MKLWLEIYVTSTQLLQTPLLRSPYLLTYKNDFQLKAHKGSLKYYVIKEVGRWGQKMTIFDDLQYCKSSKRWVGLKKSKT